MAKQFIRYCPKCSLLMTILPEESIENDDGTYKSWECNRHKEPFVYSEPRYPL